MNNSDNRKKTEKATRGAHSGKGWRFKFSRGYQITEGFEAKQLCLEFGDACRFVAALVADVKKSLQSWWKAQKPKAPETKCTMVEQLRLNLLPWLSEMVAEH